MSKIFYKIYDTWLTWEYFESIKFVCTYEEFYMIFRSLFLLYTNPAQVFDVQEIKLSAR
jgi:hypothetical protein